MSLKATLKSYRAKGKALGGASQREPPARAVPSRNEVPLEFRASFSIERETTFFITREALGASVSLKSLPVSHLTQHYFPNRAVEFVKRYALMLAAKYGAHDIYQKIEQTKFKSGRLRRKKEGISVVHTLELKGARSGADRSRPELSIQIDASTYCELLDHANEGSLEKLRHRLHGRLHSKSGKGIRVQAEIDFIVGAGQPRGVDCKPPTLQVPSDFALVDIEFPAELHAELASRHFHTFEFLALHGVELTRAPRDLRKPLSARYLARNGVTRETLVSVKRLRKLSLQSALTRAASKA